MYKPIAIVFFHHCLLAFEFLPQTYKKIKSEPLRVVKNIKKTTKQFFLSKIISFLCEIQCDFP